MRSRVVSGWPSLPSFVSSSVGHVRRRRRWRHADQHFHHPLAAQHRRRAVGERRLHEHAALAEHAAARAVGIGDSPELVARDVRNAVVLREALVHERVVRREQVENAAVVLDDVVEEELRLRAPSRRRAAGRSPGTRRRRDEPSRGPAAAATARRSAWTAPRSADRRACASLRASSVFLFGQLVLLRERQQLLVGDAAPEEERQPRRELVDR